MFLLLGADYYGTLAAVRCLGQQKVPVFVADDNKKARALYSRYVTERHVHPPLSRPDELVRWLVAFGEKHPGTVLYPTNDHLAWLFAARRDELSRAFHMYNPGEEVILSLLDKKRLSAACAAVGIDTPDTRFADTKAELDAIKANARFPLLIKPRTQIYLESGIKGSLVQRPEELDAELERYRSLVKFNDALISRHPDIADPQFQEYLTAAETSIYSVSGFVTKEGTLVARASMKVLQRPRKVGIGLCFESRPLEPAVLDKLQALCARIGYHGAFEVEYIADGDRRLMIDFNPRFFSQMAFDVARGVPIPTFAWLGARGEDAELERRVKAARDHQPKDDRVYVHRTMLDLVLVLQGMSGQMPRADRKRWRTWLHEHHGLVTDAVRQGGDPMPAVIDTAQWLQHFAKHPRSFIRNFVFNR